MNTQIYPGASLTAEKDRAKTCDLYVAAYEKALAAGVMRPARLDIMLPKLLQKTSFRHDRTTGFGNEMTTRRTSRAAVLNALHMTFICSTMCLYCTSTGASPSEETTSFVKAFVAYFAH